MPRVLRVDADHPDPASIAEAVRVLRAGGLVAFPTETVYGLGARALDEAALARVFAAKGRPPHHPLIAHVEGEAQARGLARTWSERTSRLARAFWPGPLTLVVERAPHVPAAVAGGGDSIAVRAPAHSVARALLLAVAEPLAAPSANRFQGLSPTTAEHVERSLGDSVDLILDAGRCPAGIESTVVDVRAEVARILRPGALDLAALRAVGPHVVRESAAEVAPVAATRASPGMDVRHYAPRARLIIAETVDDAQRAALGLAGGGAKVGLVLHSSRPRDSVLDLSRSTRILVRVLPEEATGYARELFGVLHDMDALGVDAIVVENVPGDDAWWAVADRLRRAAAPRT